MSLSSYKCNACGKEVGTDRALPGGLVYHGYCYDTLKARAEKKACVHHVTYGAPVHARLNGRVSIQFPIPYPYCAKCGDKL